VAKKEVVFDFYSIDYDDYGKLEQRLKQDMTSFVKRWYDHKYQKIRLESWEYKNDDEDIYVGLASKLNLRELPLKGDTSSADLEELGLKENEGTASVTAFAIIPEYRTLILAWLFPGELCKPPGFAPVLQL